MKDLTPEEAARRLDAVPEVVQRAVLGERTGQVIERLGTKHSLHVDMQGTLAKLVSYMLVGYINPQQAYEELLKENIPEAEVKQIFSDLNTEIFLPLQQQLRQGSATSAPPTPRPAIPTPSYKPPPPPLPKPPPPSLRRSLGEGEPPPPPMPRPTSPPPPSANFPHDVIKKVASVPTASVGAAVSAPLPPKMTMPGQTFRPQNSSPLPPSPPHLP